jgi:hypothetical protein
LREVLSLFKKDKSPGPNGWKIEFFTFFFDLVGDNLLEMVKESRKKGLIAGGLNSTFISLIPKTNNLTTFCDYRPISVCNLCYKLITKIIANRIRPILSRSLSVEQHGFLKGIQIHDAIGITHECLHNVKKEKNKSLILKPDLQKAYDCIEWDLLRMILIQVGFGLQFTNWIMSCVSTSTFVVLINGEATNFFRSNRRL